MVGSCCVYLKIIRAKEAANDDGGVHISAQIRQWTTITGLRYDGQRPNPLFAAHVSFCTASVLKLVYLCVFCISISVFVSVFASTSVFLHGSLLPGRSMMVRGPMLCLQHRL